MTNVVAVIPTFNEPSLIRDCIVSLRAQGEPIEIVIGNAGDPLSEEILQGAREVRVDPKEFWTGQVMAALNKALSLQPAFILLCNADTVLGAGTLNVLLQEANGQAKKVAASPAYVASPTGEPHETLYTDQQSLGFLLYGKISRRWPDFAHRETLPPFPTDLIGGQGVLIPVEAFQDASFDPVRFPQYAADHDFWLQLRKKGWEIRVCPHAVVINQRGFNRQRKGSLGKTLWWRMTSEYSPESWIIMRRLRQKHLGLFVGTISTVLAFTMRWTLGLPKILRRS